MLKKVRKILLWTISVIILLIFTVVCLLYVPGVQRLVKDIALKEVKKSTGMDISVGHLRLKFPLSLSVSDVTVLEATGDTMVQAGEANIKVRFWPLLKGDIDVAGASLSDVFYQLGNRDSAIWLTARINDFALDLAFLNFGKGKIDIGEAELDGGDVMLILKDTITPETIDTVGVQQHLRITSGNVSLKNLQYRMKMLPVIDSICAFIPEARLEDGIVDLGERKISATSLSVDSVSAVYLTPSAEYLEHYVAKDSVSEITSTPDSLLWEIRADKVSLTGKSALYAMADVKPLPGLDFNYLEASNIDIVVDSFYNKGPNIRVPLSTLRATERCGISLNASGVFSIDSMIMYADSFKIRTEYSRLDFNAILGAGDLATEPNLPIVLNATGAIGDEDVKAAFPSIGKMIYPYRKVSDINIRADIKGSSGALDIKNISVDYRPILDIHAHGKVDMIANFDEINGNVSLNGSLRNLNSFKSLFFTPETANEINLPDITLNGKVNYNPKKISGILTATADDGHIAADASWQQKIDGYDISIDIDKLPIGAILPSLELDEITASLQAKGKGFDIYSTKTNFDITAEINEATYRGYTYSNITAAATLEDGNLTADIISNNRDAEFDIELKGSISKEGYTWKLDGDIEALNLKELGLSETENSGSVMITSQGSMNVDGRNLDGWLTINDFDWDMDGKRLYTERIEANMSVNDSLIFATLKSGDLDVRMASLSPLDTLITKITLLPEVLDSAIAQRNANIPALQQAIPNIDIEISAGSSNILQDYLLQSDMGFKKASFSFRNDSLLSLDAKVLGFISKDTRLDTITLGAVQHGKFLAFTGGLDNRPGTMDNFAHVKLTGYLAEDKVTLVLRQRNIENEQGFFLGANLNVTDSTATLRFVPYNPTIGYKEWTLNKDNFLQYNFTNRHIDANLSMSSDKSFIRVYTEHNNNSIHQEDVILQMSQIQLADWLSISPFSPPIKGDVGANVRIHWDEGVLTGDGNVSLDNLYYGRDRVGNFNLGVDVTTRKSGALAASASLMIDSVKVITATGVLNDSTSATPFNLDFSMIHFPLKTVNPFLPKDMAQLSGVLNGEMDITGSLSSPIFNGFLDFDSTAVRIGMLGSTLKFSEEKIPVDSSIVRFDNFTITAQNSNPLRVDGIVDLTSLSNISLDLALNARNIQIVNSTRAKKGEDVYGKAFFNVNADVRGDMRLLHVDASLAVLPGTNVTYILGDAQTALASQSTHDLVKFVQFADSATVELADTIKPTMAIVLDAQLNIEQGSTINVDLSSDGKNKVTINGQGTLDYTMSPVNSGRLTGRFNINSGFVRYTPPLMSEKLFNFEDGSYVAFNGDIMNPILNIHAVDHLRANVTQSGQDSRLIDFDITLSITNTLANMNVAFNLSTNDDITVQNELSSMTPEQRATQAMNLLLYNTYTGPGTSGNANLSGNPLYAFLASQLNSWAAKNIHGVDITFGIDQYNKTTDGYTSTATSYSYRVTKTLFNDRFTIVVGGNYSTDSNADENFEQNLISDIAFEYKLNRSGSMYLKIFRHTGYESILEGEITQTGVGFVIRRKINSLKDLFRWKFRRHHQNTGEHQHTHGSTLKANEEKKGI